MTVGFYSPLPPARTGVADYAALLLDALRRHGRVDVDAPGDVALYHLGNNGLHREIYRRALERPGVVVLHDAVLQHFFLGALDEPGYVEEFVYNYGEWMRDLARDLWRGRARSAADPRYFAYPMLRRIAETSRAVIVHNPAAARAVERHARAARVIEIPHLFVDPPPVEPWEIGRFRQRLGAGEHTAVFGVFGHLRESKRLPVVLRAFRRVLEGGTGAILVIAGDFVSSDLERSMAELAKSPRVIRAGYTEEADFRGWTAAVDACVNLRFPAAGETSGIAVRLMGIGKAVIMTEGEEIARIPEDCCLRVPCGPAEEDLLADYMAWIARSPEAAREIGRRAREHVLREHALESVAERYWRALEEAA